MLIFRNFILGGKRCLLFIINLLQSIEQQLKFPAVTLFPTEYCLQAILNVVRGRRELWWGKFLYYWWAAENNSRIPSDRFRRLGRLGRLDRLDRRTTRFWTGLMFVDQAANFR